MKAWILAVMLHVSPPDRWNSKPGFEETKEERLARYESIAADIEATVMAGETIDGNRHKDAAVLVAVTFMESGFFKDVDVGPCYRRSADSKRCDSGAAACIAQIRVRDGSTSENTHGVAGLTLQDLFDDRKKCLGVAKFMLKRSFRSCRDQGPDARMDVYASGRCGHGRAEGKKRLQLAERLMSLRLDRKTGKPLEKDPPRKVGAHEARRTGGQFFPIDESLAASWPSSSPWMIGDWVGSLVGCRDEDTAGDSRTASAQMLT